MRPIRLRTAIGRARLVLPVFLILAAGGTLPAIAHDHGQRTYDVTNLGSLGGTASAGSSINNRGWIAGFSNLPGDATVHATLWVRGSTVNLGTLGGPNSAVLWPVKNTRGMLAGVAETADMDLLHERWSCSAFFPGDPTGHVCRGFVWEHGVMRGLPTLGGTHGFATGLNNRGQVVGWAENTVHDPTCKLPQVLQFRAVLWDTGRNLVHELPPLPGDTVSAATAINDRGQVVGISGICDNAVGRFSARHAVLWENGSVTDIGSLGGVSWNTPMAINRHGDVVGFSNPPGDENGAFNARAFLWTRSGGLQPLPTLDEDTISQALGINARGQVVGLSCGAGGCRAVLWQHGVVTDLNDLVGPTYAGHLIYANDINDAGEITGQATEAGTGASVTFLGRPCRRHC